MFKKLLKYTKKKRAKEKENISSKKKLKKIAESKPASKKHSSQSPANKILTAEGWLRRQKKSM